MNDLPVDIDLESSLTEPQSYFREDEEDEIDRPWMPAVLVLIDAVRTYADSQFYHACSFEFDRPTGGFDEDFSYDEEYERDMPGLMARKALEEFRRRMPNLVPGGLDQDEIRSVDLSTGSATRVIRSWISNQLWTLGLYLVGLGTRVGSRDRGRLSQSVQSQNS